MTACDYIETIKGQPELDWPGAPMIVVKQKYNTNGFNDVSVSFTSPRKLHFDATFHWHHING